MSIQRFIGMNLTDHGINSMDLLMVQDLRMY